MTLTASDLSALSRLLDEALELDVSQRDAWLAALPAGERHLASTLREMLAEHDSTRGSRWWRGPPVLPDPGAAHPGDLVGPYRLLRPIGRGGMGEVWLAERADGSYERQVALKLPRVAWDEGLARRMARERDIGALLEHPNIARLYDAGVDERGRPFLALEYIDGAPIDVWCDAQDLDVASRLRLFLQVVRAAAYAHGRLVIHRDLKPANILVSADGQVHLLDFGIARRLREPTASDPFATRPHHAPTQEMHRALTPQYASPEQISGAPLTVQSDIYSLGILLYELLTGVSPISPKRNSPAAIEEAILQADVPLASTRVASKPMARVLRGDLDAILAQALQREPARRYATAEALAADLERHLSGQPVLARPDGWAYRQGKLLRRHRLGFSLAGLALSVVLGLAGLAVHQAQRATQEAAEARRAADRARVVKEFVLDIFKLNAPDSPEGSAARELPVSALLERGARLIEPRFAGQPELQTELLGVVTQIMLDMGAQDLAVQYAMRLRSALSAARAGGDEQAAASRTLAAALEASGIRREAVLVLKEALTQATAAPLRAEIQLDLLDLALADNRTQDASELLAGLRRGSAPMPPLLKARADQAQARLLTDTGNFSQARPLFERAIGATEAAQQPGSRQAARLRFEYGLQLIQQRLVEPGQAEWQRALKALRAIGGEDDLEAALLDVKAAQTAAQTQTNAISYQAATAIHVRALSVIDKQGPHLPARVRADVQDSWGCMELRWGRVEHGLALAMAVAKVMRPTRQSAHGGCLGWGLMMAGRHADAENEFQNYVGHLRPGGRCSAECAAHLNVAIAHNRLMHGRTKEAHELFDALPAALLAGPDRAQTSRAQRMVLAARARLALEEQQYERALAWLDGVPDGIYMMNDTAAIRAEVACRQGHAAQALPALRAAVASGADEAGNSPWQADLRARLGLCELMAGHADAARATARLARQAFTAQPAVSPAYSRVLRELEGRLQRGA